ETYELVCGYRRYHACRKLLFKSVECIVIEMDDREALEISLIDNIQRQNLNPIEEAEAFKLYVVNFGRGGVTRLAQRIGKSEEYVSQRLLLLGLPKEIKDRISRRLLKASHACELVWLKDPEKQIRLAHEIQRENLSLRQVRMLAKGMKTTAGQTNDVQSYAASEQSSDVAGNDNEEDISLLQTYERLSSDARERMSILDKTILLIRTSLAGIDMLIEKTGYQDIRDLLMQERLHMHTSLDQVIKAKMVNLRDVRRTTKEI
ncbi:MAG: ParB/RepB/Spo0J family partition protein, partial [Thaumarchaeota archaeon]|nr:ParB/RepB/Spo0J family partition protein [Nitrososphaerota archaeon]